ncbi:DUF397 domain-containing protein [Micromonospora sp. MED01]|uniref:DUF397 domain-containing protein n=1 Tax=Micromonospora alfalfae TaxID=2911212 RepID=UPI001EE8B147|nr:DUF397 domain-containing protein [Micromonospora alfalfae]MCG5464248.1 DUF397 domain-containing protein [Micromonospora alfalfae]
MRQPHGVWFKSSKSGPNCDNCVEVRDGQVVDVRDTKDRGGPVLTFAPTAFQAFAAAAAEGAFAR